ncbi:MAG: PAS domain S-box protein [Phycisphaerales bacterium]|nr:PAS domain S-box protein [Hyphomonadaceae bacterium]
MTQTAEPSGQGAHLPFRDLLDAFPAAVYTTDADGKVTFFNRMAEELAGRVPLVGVDQWCVSWRLFRPNGEPLPPDECPMAIALNEGRAVRNVEVLAERQNGERVPLMPFPTPLRDAEGNLIGAVNMLVDISALKVAEGDAARRGDEQAALCRLTDRLYQADSADDTYEAALDAIFATLRCNRASLLLFDEAGEMQFVAARGLSRAYRAAVAGHSPWTRGEKQARPFCISDVPTSDLSDELKLIVLSEGVKALAFIPLVVNGGVIGKFMTYFDAPHAFSDEQINLALTIARQIGLSIERARSADALRASEERYRALVESQAEMLCRFTRDGRIQFVNEAYARSRGTEAAPLTGASLWDFVAESDRLHVQAMLDRLTPEQPQVRIENRFETVDGERWTLWTNRVLAFGPDGRWTEAQSTGIDITDRKRTEEALRASESRYRAIVETTPECVKLVHRDGTLLHMNSSGLAMIGADCFELVEGKSIFNMIAPEDRARFKVFNESVCDGARGSLEFDIISLSGDRRHMETHATPFVTPEGETVQLAVTRDVSPRRREEEQRTLLINELNHRVKNTLATVQSLAMQTLRSTERSEDARALFDSRLAALSRAHDLLTQRSWQSADLREVVARALAPFTAIEGRFTISGPPVQLTTKQALALTIALHELATNAAKYGALSSTEGAVAIEWALTPANDFQLTWSESGGPQVTPPARTGFGTRLIKGNLAKELGGAVAMDYHPEGLVTAITAPVEDISAHTAGF